jgi:diaminopimelate epimerase
LVLIYRPTLQHTCCRMELYTENGSRAQFCGNGIRCVAKFVIDRGLFASENSTLLIETDTGVRTLKVTEGSDGEVCEVEVDMG